jgi:pimeloyl-[acyl-carrier protein] methyl ester esterase
MLHHQTVGNGDNIVLLHGWGQHSGIWSATDNNLLRHLSERYRVTTIDLPGHGHSHAGDEGFTLAAAVSAIADLIPKNSIVVAWSLGGLLALQLAREYSDCVQRLVLISSTARFSQAQDWQAAMTSQVLQGFAMALLENPLTTVQRFLALQVRGSDNERQQLRQLKRAIDTRPQPRAAALISGMEILQNTDLRTHLHTIKQPCLLLYGEHDRIVPPAAGMGMQDLLPCSVLHILSGAGHAPFLSHPETTLHLIEDFLYE